MASQAPPTNQPSSNASSTSASTSQPQPPIYLLSNICNLITVRLDSTNYVSWKFQFTSILKAHSLIEFVDGSLECPKVFLRDERGELTAEMNPNHKSWIAQDQAPMTLINATLSPTALAHIIGLNSAREVRLALERRFSSEPLAYNCEGFSWMQEMNFGSSVAMCFQFELELILSLFVVLWCVVDLENRNGLLKENYGTDQVA
ncbi:hypothetical protein F0562_023650 [Nyssa sinensis]|uniref:Retrotransposon Copia-like N-terminal domain-containing protein n=1 Tax=Nyssa sinensis TaxID=561372 RepID=A0A5J5BIP2_9ASTE|nr:hypothetical protein F0562_023650 [Nyssa sinensis]